MGSTAGRRRARCAAVGIALGAGGLLTGCTATGADPTVEPAAATAAAPGSSWFVSAGRDLACWCPLDGPCHADVLLALAAPRSSWSTSGL